MSELKNIVNKNRDVLKKVLENRIDKYGEIVNQIEKRNEDNPDVKVLIALLDIAMEWN